MPRIEYYSGAGERIMHKRQLRRRNRALGADSAKSAGSELRKVCAKAKARMRRIRDRRVGMSTLGKNRGAFCIMTGKAGKMVHL